MGLTFQIPKQYCFLQHQTYFHHQSHLQLGVIFAWLHLFILFGVISPLFSSSILDTYHPGEFILQCPVFLPFHIFYTVLHICCFQFLSVKFQPPNHLIIIFFVSLTSVFSPLGNRIPSFSDICPESDHFSSYLHPSTVNSKNYHLLWMMAFLSVLIFPLYSLSI